MSGRVDIMKRGMGVVALALAVGCGFARSLT